ncbi:MAG TPA: hypothetical protein VGF40_03015 [Thermoanaerobaculia bacterium]
MGRKSGEAKERAAERAQTIPDEDAEFLRKLMAADDGEWDRVPLEVLAESGKVYAAAARLDDAGLTAELRRLVEDLASIGIFLHSTDHLSDRELYETLTGDMLLEPMMIAPEPGWHTHLDPIGGFSAEDLQIYYRYYADDAYRDDFRERYPGEPLPPRETPPYDRDRFLPNGELGILTWQGES